MKIYVASSWRNKYYDEVVECLKLAEFEVYDFRNPPNKAGFGWEQINEGWKDWTTEEYISALNHPLAEVGYQSDIGALQKCDACVIVMPCGRSAHLEAGIAIGMGKPVIAYIPENQEPELMYKAMEIANGMTDVIDFLHAQKWNFR